MKHNLSTGNRISDTSRYKISPLKLFDKRFNRLNGVRRFVRTAHEAEGGDKWNTLYSRRLKTEFGLQNMKDIKGEERVRPFHKMRSHRTKLCDCLTNQLVALILC